MPKHKPIENRIVRLETINGYTITGQTNINREPGYNRLSDLVANNDEDFIVIVNATMTRENLEKTIKHKTLLVNRAHIVWVAPDETQA